jgi:PAS domain S-box-containing protein
MGQNLPGCHLSDNGMTTSGSTFTSLCGPAGVLALAGIFLALLAWTKFKHADDSKNHRLAQEEAHRAILAGEGKLRAIFEAATEAIYVVGKNPDGTPGPVLLHNPAAEAMLGPGKDSRFRPSLNFSDLVPEGRRPAWAQTAEELSAEKKVSYTSRRLRNDGSEVPVEGNAVPLDLGDAKGFLLVERDASEREQNETERAVIDAKLRRAHALEAVSTLAGGVAHEFNNLLAVVLGYTELALESEGLEPHLKNDLVQVRIAADRARDLVEQLLLFSRQTSGERGPLALRVLVKEALKRARIDLPGNLELVDEIAAEVPKVQANPAQMSQVLENLLKNAREALGEHVGTITVHLDTVDLDAFPGSDGTNFSAGKYVRLRVTDDGPGMPPEVQAKAFDPFYSTKHDSGRSESDQPGLGLSVVHGIIREHGGDVSLLSRKGGGTSVTVLLPAVPAGFHEAPA